MESHFNSPKQITALFLLIEEFWRINPISVKSLIREMGNLKKAGLNGLLRELLIGGPLFIFVIF